MNVANYLLHSSKKYIKEPPSYPNGCLLVLALLFDRPFPSEQGNTTCLFPFGFSYIFDTTLESTSWSFYQDICMDGQNDGADDESKDLTQTITCIVTKSINLGLRDNGTGQKGHEEQTRSQYLRYHSGKEAAVCVDVPSQPDPERPQVSATPLHC